MLPLGEVEMEIPPNDIPANDLMNDIVFMRLSDITAQFRGTQLISL